MKRFENRVVIVSRATRLENVLVSHNTVSQARFYIKQLGGDFDDYENEHNQYAESLKLVRRSLDELVNVQVLDRKFLPNFIFAPEDIVVVVGQDGLVANTLKYLNGQPVIGVNPDVKRWDGVLLPFKPNDVSKVFKDTISGNRKFEDVTMARAKVQNGQELLAVNDFFIGQKTHASARYVIKYGGLKENQSSSGIIVSTGLGSTGWMKSILAGSSRINDSVIGKPFGAAQERDDLTEVDDDMIKLKQKLRSQVSCYLAQDEVDDDDMCLYEADYDDSEEDKNKKYLREIPQDRMDMPRMRKVSGAASFSDFSRAEKLSKSKKVFGHSELSNVVGKWSTTELLFAVREPFPSKTTGTNLVFGTVSPSTPLKIESLMGENGVIFSDGIENDFIIFNSGTEVEISLADKRGKMVV